MCRHVYRPAFRQPTASTTCSRLSAESAFIPELLNTSSSRRHAFFRSGVDGAIYQSAQATRFTGSGHFAKTDKNGPNGPYVILGLEGCYSSLRPLARPAAPIGTKR
jgi:hypothetical protein